MDPKDRDRRQQQAQRIPEAGPSLPRPPPTLNGYIIPPVYREPVRRNEPPGQSAKKTAAKHAAPGRSAVRQSTGRTGTSSSSRVRFGPPAANRAIKETRMSYAAKTMPRSVMTAPPWNVDATRSTQGIPRKGSSKTTLELKPLWKQLDDDYAEETLRYNKRTREGRSRRIGGRMGGPGNANQEQDIEMRGPGHTVSEIAPVLKLRTNGIIEESDDEDDEIDDDDGDEDEPRYQPQPRIILQPAKKTPMPARAARKLEYWDTSSESSESSEGVEEEDSSSTTSGSVAIIEPDNDVEMDDDIIQDDSDSPEIILLEPPRRYSPPPQATDPPLELLDAVKALSAPVINLQAKKRLPFLVRNLRRGLLSRCSRLQVPIFTDGRDVNLFLVYEHFTGAKYQANITAWKCPLCNLMGSVKTREILDCHLKWDHSDVFFEWEEGMQTEKSESWHLRILIPEINSDEPEQHTNIQLPAEVEMASAEQPKTPPKPPATNRFSSPFPSVSMSPPTPKPIIAPAPRSPTPRLKVEIKEEDTGIFSRERSMTQTTGEITTSNSGTGTRTSGTSRGSVASTTATVRALRISRNGNITPPPPEAPLGAATQPPYLPAKSDYGGPTVHYSCRPNGPCLFDLLGTLPMEPFGVLDWDIIDREDEIYETDQVKDEYKVIQALWMRWINLQANRNAFMANYCKGTISFVDFYWKIIHRAAGWDALRFWLLTLLANRFLTGAEVAQILRHYESLTGMSSWYEE